MAQEREKTFDLIKLYSMFLVITNHFLVHYVIYESTPMKILNGKFGVQLFSVVLGIFAFRSGQKNKESSFHYALRRYIYFFICEFLINNIYFALNVNDCRTIMTYGFVIGQSILLGDVIFPTFWFLKDYLVGSILCFLIGKKNYDKLDIVMIICCLGIVGEIFVAACIIGCLTCKLLNENKPLYKTTLFQVCGFALPLIVRIILEKNNITYFIFGLLSMLLVLTWKNNHFVEKISDLSFISYLGTITMPILMVHPHLIDIVNRFNFSIDGRITIVMRYITMLVLVLVMSVVLDIIIRRCVKISNTLIDRLFEKIQKA